jgi:hypothetical protein
MAALAPTLPWCAGLLPWIESHWPEISCAGNPTVTPLHLDRGAGHAFRYLLSTALYHIESKAPSIQSTYGSEANASRLVREAVKDGLEGAAQAQVHRLFGQPGPDSLPGTTVAGYDTGIGVPVVPSASLRRPREEDMRRTLLDSPGAPFLVPASRVSPTLKTLCAQHHDKVHGVIECLALDGTDGGIETPRLKSISQLISIFGLVAKQTGDSQNAIPEDADADAAAADADTAGGKPIVGLGVTYCMMETGKRLWVLLQSAMEASCRPGTKASMPPSQVLSVVLSLAYADCGSTYVFPGAAFGPARTLIIRLNDAGFVLPCELEGGQYFVIHPSLGEVVRDFGRAFTSVGSVTRTQVTTGGGVLGFSLFDAALMPYLPRSMTNRAAEKRSRAADAAHLAPGDSGSAVPLPPPQPSAELVKRVDNARSALRALIQLGHSSDVNAVSHHGRWFDQHLAGQQGSENADGTAWAHDADTIVTETNYRLYVYLRPCDPGRLKPGGTADPAAVLAALPRPSQTLLRLLDQFAVRDVLVPRFAVYRLTRDKFLGAVRSGVTQSQILAFLAANAHPSARAKDPGANSASESAGAVTSTALQAVVDLATSDGASAAAAAAAAAVAAAQVFPAVPRSIADQLAMWEREARRVRFQSPAVLLQAPNSIVAARVVEVLRSVPEFADGRGVMERRGLLLVLTAAAYQAIAARLPKPVNSAPR